MAKNIVELNIDNTSYNCRPFGTCVTDARTVVKDVTCADFVLVTNATILVKFTYTNATAAPLLNVNNTGAKSITWEGSTTSIISKIKAGQIYEFIYDGTSWVCLGGIDSNDDTRVSQISTTTNAVYPLLMTYTASPSSTITNSVRYNTGLAYNPSTQTLGLGVLKCTPNESDDTSHIVDIFTNNQLPTTFRIGLPYGNTNTAPANYINLMYSGPGINSTDSKGSKGLLLGPKITDDTTNGFLIGTDKPLYIEGSSLEIASNVVPNEDGEHNLGSSGRQWNTVYANKFTGVADFALEVPYGTCPTAATTVAKEVQITSSFLGNSFRLSDGARISVKFSNDHTATSMTLNVNDTGAKSVKLNNSTTLPSNVIISGNVYEFIYDGLYWILEPGIQNTAGSGHSTSKLFLIGATTQDSDGVKTYSNSNVYTQSGEIYANGGFYDKSTPAASVYKAVVPKDYTELAGGFTTTLTHSLARTLTLDAELMLPRYGGLVGEFAINFPTHTITVNPLSISANFNTTLQLTITSSVEGQNFRFVRFLLAVPLTVKNNGQFSTSFRYNIACIHNGTTKSSTITLPLAIGASATIGTLSVIYDLAKDTVINDTANGTSSWL